MPEICDFLGLCKALVYRTLKRSRAGEPLEQRNPSKRARIRGSQLQSIRRTTLIHYMDPVCPRAPREGPVSTVQQLVRLVIVAVSVALCTRLRARATQRRVAFIVRWYTVTVRAVRKRHAALGVQGFVELRMWITNSPASGGSKPLRTFFAALPCGSTRSVSKSRRNSSAAPSVAASRELLAWPAGADAHSRS